MSEVPAPFTLLRDLFEQRSSVRGFLSTPLPRSQLHDVFAAAQRAPSWCNIQPWRVIVTGPEETSALTSALAEASATGPPCPEVPFPSEYPSPYQERRRACGRALYQAMGIARDDAPRRREAWLQNYRAFNAPHLAIVTCDLTLIWMWECGSVTSWPQVQPLGWRRARWPRSRASLRYCAPCFRSPTMMLFYSV
jgi:nitroreductase